MGVNGVYACKGVGGTTDAMMKWLAAILVLVSFTARAGHVSHEIRYSNKNAREVFLVWGINNWQQLPNDQLPPGSYIKDQLIHTPMTLNSEGQFAVALNVPQGTVIDHVFWITKGPLGKSSDVWDLNAPRKDYHALASANSITLIKSTLPVRPAENVSLLDFSTLILFFVLIIALIAIVAKRKRNERPSPLFIIAGSALSLLLFLFLLRPSVVGFSWDLLTDPLSHFPKALYGGYHDILYVIALTLPFVLVALILRNRNRALKVLTGVFLMSCMVSLVASIVNIKAVDLLGKPFNYRWLYYSDFLNGPDAQAAMSANLDGKELWSIIALVLSFFLTAFLTALLVQAMRKRRVLSAISISSIVGSIILYLLLVPSQLQKQNWESDRLDNPVAAFLQSVNPWQDDPGLFTMEVTDSLRYKKPSGPATNLTSSSGFRNVILFVLESTPAEYIDCYGGKYGATPRLTELAKNAVLFRNVYAHAPGTNLSMVSMLNSCYPWLSFESITDKHPDFPSPSIAEALKNKGYRTGFFNSADNRYQNAGEFLVHRRFDKISDCRDQSCNAAFFDVKDEKNWKFLSGKDDGCTAQELMNWITESPGQPFFGMMWTYQTHYPYFNSQPLKVYDKANPSLNRYLNALHYADSLIGDIAQQLEKKGLSESTLLVVVGDHGEAFGRHGQITHARMIYEENLHVPCMIINPSFGGKSHSGIGGLVDVAPTLMKLLNHPSPGQWEGDDLFAKNVNDQVYFFAPWSDYLFGYRTGNIKYIFNASKGSSEIYDLLTDPYETNNLAGNHTADIPLHQQRLAAWTQYVNSRTREILSRSQPGTIIAQVP